MISMVIVLFLVAVAISLFFGRIAEILLKRLNERARRADFANPLVRRREPLVTAVKADTGKAA